MALILWNMNRFNTDVSSLYMAFEPGTSVWLYLFLVVVIPWLILGAIYFLYMSRVKEEKPTEVLAPMAGAAARMATELEEPRYEDISERPKPSFITRILGLAVPAIILIVFAMYGGGW